MGNYEEEEEIEPNIIMPERDIQIQYNTYNE